MVRDSRSNSRPWPLSSDSWLTGGHLVQQLGVVGAVLFEVTALARVTQLIWRSRSEIDCLDPLGGRLGLLRHRVGQRGLGGAVADPGFERAVDGQHEHDEADQRDDVFGEQALAQQPDFVLDPDHPDPRKAAPGTGIRAAALWPSQRWPLLTLFQLSGCGRTSARDG